MRKTFWNNRKSETGTRGEIRLGSRSGSFLKSERTIAFIAAVITVLIGLLVGFFILLFVAPEKAVLGMQILTSGGFGRIGVISGIGRVLYYAVPLIMCGLSVGFSLRANIFNIGVAGQYMMGMSAAIFVGIYGAGSFGSFSWVIAILAGGAAGAAWGLIQGLLQAYFRINAIICGIMLNYVGVYLANMLMMSSQRIYVQGNGWTQTVPDAFVLPKSGFDLLLGANTNANVGIIICIILCIVTWWILKKTTLGYEIKAVGLNNDASLYAGISTPKTIIVSMTISGAFAGFGGAMNQLGASGTRYMVSDNLPAQGMTGISVALIAASNPIGIIVSGLLIAFFQVGGVNMSSLGLDPQFVSVITSVIIYCCAFSLIIRYLLKKLFNRTNGKRKDKQNA